MPRINAALLAVLLLAMALLLPGPVRAGAGLSVARSVTPRVLLPVVPGPPAGESVAVAADGRCADAAGAWLGMRWRGELRWRVNDATIPGYLGDRETVVAAIRSAATTVDTGRNDCGLPENLDIRQHYAGRTDRRAGVTADGGCADRDGQNAVSFGSLNPGLLAVTCIWWYGGKPEGRSVETDILIDSTAGLFFLDTPPGCTGRWDLEGTLTHEFGHAFGLGHVTFAEHGTLTMTDGLPDCSTAYRGLGLGDYLTLKRQYGAR